jgi:hypothetical protein
VQQDDESLHCSSKPVDGSCGELDDEKEELDTQVETGRNLLYPSAHPELPRVMPSLNFLGFQRFEG